MQLKKLAFAAALAAGIGFVLPGPQPLGVASAWAACDPGDKIDGSTATDAKKKIEAAGYKQVKDLKKACDNYWHGTALKDGAPVNVVLTAKGVVMVEGN